MNSNWGLVDPLSERVRDKRVKRERLAFRANEDFAMWLETLGLAKPDGRGWPDHENSWYGDANQAGRVGGEGLSEGSLA